MRKTKAKTRKTGGKTKAPRKRQTKAAARTKTAGSGGHAWPGLPPGYFDRAR